MRQQPQSQTQPQPSNQPHDSSNYDQQQSGAHHRANSGPTIAISLFPESENSNCKCTFNGVEKRKEINENRVHSRNFPY